MHLTGFLDYYFINSMGSKEKNLINEYLVGLPENMRLFRFNAGMAWSGTPIGSPGHQLILKNPRPFHGAPKGFPDMAGWTTIEITPEMVGQKVAVFTGIEAKATGKLSGDQVKFKSLIESSGGKFIVLNHR